jgi:hypothetical protein
LSNFVYQSWLADRGVHTPGSQPYDVLDAKIDINSRLLLLSVGSEQAKSTECVQLQKLTRALGEGDKLVVSWMLLTQSAVSVSLPALRSLMPGLTRVICLDDSMVGDGDLFKTEVTALASRPLELFYGPSLATMNENSATKSAFWNQLRSWNG